MQQLQLCQLCDKRVHFSVDIVFHQKYKYSQGYISDFIKLDLKAM